MKKKDGTKNLETLRIRLSTELLNRIKTAKEPAGWGEEAESSFARHLIILGIQEIEQNLKQKQSDSYTKIPAEAKKGKELGKTGTDDRHR